MVKRVICCVLLTAAMLMSSACSFMIPEKLRGPHLKERLFYDDTEIAESALEQILDSIKNQDEEALKSVFSKNALIEAEDMDSGIEYLFDFVQGNVTSYDFRTGPGSDGLIENGNRWEKLVSWFNVVTDKEKYVFFILQYSVDTFDPDNVGVYSLRVVKEADEYTQMTYWTDMEIPGIYQPET